MVEKEGLLDSGIEESLNRALETASDEETRYHIREALQRCVIDEVE